MNMMKTGWSLTSTCLGLSLLLAAMLAFGQEGPAAAQTQSAATRAQQPAVAESEELPDSPGAVQSQDTSGNSSVSGQQSAPQPNPPAVQTQPATTPPAQPPVGTAAARTANPSGIAASEPAGAAIAPAKQRRARIILISVAAIVGAAAAVGIVAGLSAASPSRPPGAH